MDITSALAPKSDQLDAIELVNPRTFTIDTGSRLGNREGQAVVEIRLVDFPRVWRPSKGMLDVLVAVWGTNAAEWVGKSITLYNDADVTFGKDKVGGVRIAAMSGIEKETTVSIRGRGQGARKMPWRIQPLADAPAIDITTYTPELDHATNVDALKAAFFAAPANVQKDARFIAVKDAKKAELAGQETDA